MSESFPLSNPQPIGADAKALSAHLAKCVPAQKRNGFHRRVSGTMYSGEMGLCGKPFGFCSCQFPTLTDTGNGKELRLLCTSERKWCEIEVKR